MRQIDISSNLTDALSPQAHDAFTSADNAYARLVVHGDGNPAMREKLRALSPDNVLVKPPVSRPDAEALLSALWLWHDFLDESHVISQSLHSPTGSFWHAIMHRREGDFSNSKYWYARCADHPVLQQLPRFANDILHPLPADKSYLRLTCGGWDPNAFVDLAEELHHHPEDRRHPTAVALQRLEWKLLFDHCARVASGQ